MVNQQRDNRQELQRQAVLQFLSKSSFRFHGSDVLVFIPVHNEEHAIAQVVRKIRNACDFDILVIDDGSTDSTPDILSKLDVEVLRQPVCLGSLYTLSAFGVGSSLGYKYMVKLDGDDQQNPRDLPRLYEHAISTKADIVIGSRHLNGFTANIFSIKGAGMWFCSKLVSLLLRKQITDSTSGYRIWNSRTYKTMTQALKSGRLKEESTYEIEELMIAAKMKLKVEEISVVMRKRQFGESKSYSIKKMASFPPNLIRSTIRALTYRS